MPDYQPGLIALLNERTVPNTVWTYTNKEIDRLKGQGAENTLSGLHGRLIAWQEFRDSVDSDLRLNEESIAQERSRPL